MVHYKVLLLILFVMVSIPIVIIDIKKLIIPNRLVAAGVLAMLAGLMYSSTMHTVNIAPGLAFAFSYDYYLNRRVAVGYKTTTFSSSRNLAHARMYMQLAPRCVYATIARIHSVSTLQ
jgi:hypothetical protein